MKALWAPLARVSFLRANRFALPVVFFHGRHDRNVSASQLDEWFHTVHAPSKKLVWFEDSGHYLSEEEVGKTLLTVVRDVPPLAHDRASR